MEIKIGEKISLQLSKIIRPCLNTNDLINICKKFPDIDFNEAGLHAVITTQRNVNKNNFPIVMMALQVAFRNNILIQQEARMRKGELERLLENHG